MTLRPALGNYAAGDRFWDREREVAEIGAYLADGQGVLLTGPRRVGKTSVVHRVLEAMAPAALTVFVDVEQHATPGEMFAGLAASASGDLGFWHRIRGWFGKRLGDVAGPTPSRHGTRPPRSAPSRHWRGQPHLTLADGAARQVHAQLGLGVPYHVQLLMDELRRDADRRGNRYVMPDDVSRVYRGSFLTSSVRAHLLHLETRLRTVLGEGDALRLARDLLTQAAALPPLTPDDATILAEDLVEDVDQRLPTLREVLEILEHDAYLGRDPDGWRFRSQAVCDWWRQGNEMGFIPARDRKRRKPRA